MVICFNDRIIFLSLEPDVKVYIGDGAAEDGQLVSIDAAILGCIIYRIRIFSSGDVIYTDGP